MTTSRTDVLRDQFELVWALLDYHLERLDDHDFGWEPAQLTWTVRADGNGGWVPDWADSEPDPIPVPTVAWLTWHIGWWWTVAIDHGRHRTPHERTEIRWPGPGSATIEWLRDLRAQWLDILDTITDAELDAPAEFPWPSDAGKAVAHAVAWVNAELMKNAAEIGQLRLLRAANTDGGEAIPR
ncbi:DinB family protein [Nocardia sp. NPDC005978]|uniref:DinB family protein n=1 Tax=Nocardia sp. NPDC005978 TaxID=3156725 RepID=UPI0033B45C5B